jgi:pimeloyl-ACP methyl ester carboxylesterase
MESWKRISNYFMDKTTVIIADLPGMGMADHLPAGYDLDFLVDSIHRILEEASIDKVYRISCTVLCLDNSLTFALL